MKDAERDQLVQWILSIQRSYGELMVHKCYLICGDYEAARDCVQETITRLLVGTFPGSLVSTRKLMWTICVRIAIGLTYRKEINDRYEDVARYMLPDEEKPSDLAVDYYPISNLVLNSIGDLREEEQMAIAAYVYGIPIREMARICNLSNDSTQYHLRAALKKLRNIAHGRKMKNVVKFKDDPILDNVYYLRACKKWPYKSIAAHLGLTEKQAIAKYHWRAKMIAKYPQHFKQLKTA